MTEINHYTAESSELGDAGYEGCPWSVESLKDEGAEMSVRVAPTRLQSMIISLHFPSHSFYLLHQIIQTFGNRPLL